MKRKQFIKGSVVLSLFCAGILAALMLPGQASGFGAARGFGPGRSDVAWTAIVS